jgi:transposase
LARLSASEWLAELAVWVPDEQTHQLRQLTRTRSHLVKHTTMLRNAIRAVLRGEGLQCPAANLMGDKAQAWLEATTARLPTMVAACLQHLRASLAQLQADLEALDACLEEQVAPDERCRQLDTIAGCGVTTAATVVAEIGDIRRFHSAKALRKYAGLTPTITQSGERALTGRLVRPCNKFLKQVLILIAQGYARSGQVDDTSLKKTYYRCFFRHGPNPAKVALARQLCDVLFAMLRDGTDFNPKRLAAA